MAILTKRGEKEYTMANLIQNAMYLGGSVVFFCLLLLTVLF